MRTLLTTTWAALWLLLPGRLLAQGTSPWVDAVNELQTQFTGPIARGLSLIAIVGGGLMFGFGDGGGRGELPGLAVLMRGLRRWPGYGALNRPLTVLGVERRLFLLGATLAVAVWNATASLVAGGLVFTHLYRHGARPRPGTVGTGGRRSRGT